MQATNQKPSLYNNAFHGSVSPSIIYLAAGIYYERIVYRSEKIAYFAKAGYGGYTIIMSGTGDFIVAQGGIVTGANKSHFEAGLGATYLSTVDDSPIRKVLPAAYAGYRRQKPGGHGVFRRRIRVSRVSVCWSGDFLFRFRTEKIYFSVSVN